MENKDLENRILKLEARAKNENLMGNYAFSLTAGRYHEITNLFAMPKAPPNTSRCRPSPTGPSTSPRPIES